MARLPYARVGSNRVRLFNVRNCVYLDEDTYVLNYEDRVFRLDDLQSVDFIVVPFSRAPGLAHTMLSFGWTDGRYLCVSVEVRLEEGESYSPLGGSLHQYEIMYVVADERDVIRLRTELRGDDVYVYRTTASPSQARTMFVDVLKRINRLRREPEFYDTVSNNCTTNIVRHLNQILNERLPWDPSLLLTGYSDRTAYGLGLLVDYGSFDATRRRANITDLAHRFAYEPDFSTLIRSSQNNRVDTRPVASNLTQQRRPFSTWR